MWQFANGIDERPLIPASEPQKSYSPQVTFNEDVTDEEYVEAVLRRMADRLFATVREEAPEYFGCLARHRVTHIFNNWDAMPPVSEQMALPGNTTIALKNAKEELALPVNGKKSNLTRRDLVDYFARDRLGIKEAVLNDVFSRFTKALPIWYKVLDRSFLSADAKQHYASVLEERIKRLKF